MCLSGVNKRLVWFSGSLGSQSRNTNLNRTHSQAQIITPECSESAPKNVIKLNLNRNFNLKFTESFNLQLQMKLIKKKG